MDQHAAKLGPDRTARKRGWRRLVFGMIGYSVTILIVFLLLGIDTFARPLAVILALLPIAFAAWAMTGWLMAVRTVDELQQKLYSEAGLISLGITGLVTFTYGFLEALPGVPKLSMIWVWPLIALCWVVALPLVKRHYG